MNAQRKTIRIPAQVPSHVPLRTSDMFAGLSTPTLEQSRALSISLATIAKIVMLEASQTPRSAISRPSEAHEIMIMIMIMTMIMTMIMIMSRSTTYSSPGDSLAPWVELVCA